MEAHQLSSRFKTLITKSMQKNLQKYRSLQQVNQKGIFLLRMDLNLLIGNNNLLTSKHLTQSLRIALKEESTTLTKRKT